MTITFETLQSNLQTMLKLADVKVGTKKAIELEHVYVLAPVSYTHLTLPTKRIV